mgnify:FL=1
MLQYLVILLDDTSVSYCHYDNRKSEHRLISLENLKAGILFAMKETLMLQFVYPHYELPQAYKDEIETIDHSKIVPVEYRDEADVVVLDDWEQLSVSGCDIQKTYVLRTGKTGFFKNYTILNEVLDKVLRLNVVLVDIDTFTESDFDIYKSVLDELALKLKGMYLEGMAPQLNLLTDRMMLDKMNNCNAGVENITLAPDGKFYICPAFYLADDGYSIGSLVEVLDIKNPKLYKLSYAPLCRNCDAYQCKRCIWMNWKTTLEVNTPSHEQCVVAHLERNTSRSLLLDIRRYGTFLPGHEIKEITYLDPFDVRQEF